MRCWLGGASSSLGSFRLSHRGRLQPHELAAKTDAFGLNWRQAQSFMGKKRAASFVGSLENGKGTSTAKDYRAKSILGPKVKVVKAAKTEGLASETQADEAPKKQKKRSYANAYVRKGQGLNAIINEVMAEKERLLDKSDAALLTSSSPSQLLADASMSKNNAERMQDIKQEINEPLLAAQPQVKIEGDSGCLDSVAALQSAPLVDPVPPKKTRGRARTKKAVSAGAAGLIDNTPQTDANGEDHVAAEKLADNLTKTGKPRRRAVKANPTPAVKGKKKVEHKPPTASSLEVAAALPPGKAQLSNTQNPAAHGDLGFGFTKNGKPRKRPAPKPKAEPVVKTEGDDSHNGVGSGDNAKLEAAKAPKRRRTKKAQLEDVVKMECEKTQNGKDGEQPKKKRRRGPDPNAFQIPSPDILEEAQKTVVADRPVPNLGFACLNATLRAQKPPLFTNRGCIKKTFEEKGLDYISFLALENCKSIAGLVLWNHLNGIRFFRMSSCIFPWCSEWTFDQLKDKAEIKNALQFAGDLARAYDQRLTFHPTHFVKLGCEESPLLDRSLHELEQHSLILDLMGYEPSPINKINIHIGGTYGDKEATIDRFAKNFKRLSPNCQKRLTVENDDRGNSYSLKELMRLHELIGVPLVFDFHHHRFCTGDLSEEEAFKLALTTWPTGVRPVVHWSESQEGRKPAAHSDFVKGPLRLYGLDDQIDVMIEAKGKELALLRLRDPTYTPSAAALALIYASPE